jgi:hypothetical protein
MHQPRVSLFRFSLRTLLILVTLGAAAFGWFGIKMRQAQRQKESVAAVRNLGGIVGYDYEFDSVGNQKANASPPTPAWLRKTLGDDFFAEVKYVFLCGCGADDETLVLIRGMPRLESLNISYTTKITDDGLANLASLTELRELRMSNTGVTDAGLAHLRGLKKLKDLNLARTHVTDAVLKQMTDYPALEELNVWHTQVTDAALKQLRQAFPKLVTND